jgi:hypothetical protein
MADVSPNIASLIALAPKGPSVDFSGVGNLPNSYWEGLNQAHQQELQDLFKNNKNLTNPDGSLNFSQLVPAYLRVAGAAGVPSAMPLIRSANAH